MNYIKVNKNLIARNPVLFINRYYKNYIVYKYSGPIEGCNILSEIVVINRRSANMFYDWNQLNYFFNKYNLFFKDIHITKYNIDNINKYNYVITFNDNDYLWERKFNTSDKGGINELIIQLDNHNKSFGMYELLSEHYNIPNITNKKLSEVLLKINPVLNNYCCGNGCVNCVNNNL